MKKASNKIIQFRFQEIFHKPAGVFILLFLVILNQSCNSVQGAKSTQQLNLKFTEIAGNEFLINYEKDAEIEHCISTDNKLKARIENLGLISLEEEEGVDDQISRKIIRRGNFTKGIPKDDLTENVKYEFFICVDRNGEVLLANLIKSNQNLNKEELRKLLTTVFEYQYEKKMGSTCLQCGNLFVKYN